jgi:hypothetical protein
VAHEPFLGVGSGECMSVQYTNRLGTPCFPLQHTASSNSTEVVAIAHSFGCGSGARQSATAAVQLQPKTAARHRLPFGDLVHAHTFSNAKLA